MFLRNLCICLAVLVAAPAFAQQVRNIDRPLIALTTFEQSRLLGDWFEVARTPTMLGRDCHGTTVRIEERDDSRLTLKINCHVGRLEGSVLAIEGIIVELSPGVFVARLNRLPQIGNLPMIVLWEDEEAGLLVLGAPRGEIGFLWSREATPDAAALDTARQALVAQGYRTDLIETVPHAP
ncbi:lipocalin family protein [Maritimibacter dapengensis]|uniref:Lipocalin family protein n=1 Tax=Maritimibacter dapengensis TaxID=2836868 RepID=A0ABS6SZN2_9RHOB|nr:lipocalin family protein [Maritimibacter dapengensis]MBV7378445.1 lipocalin family protein [Maritimibacter dapengensis]